VVVAVGEQVGEEDRRLVTEHFESIIDAWLADACKAYHMQVKKAMDATNVSACVRSFGEGCKAGGCLT
jgi:hypothetical protein